MVRLTFSDRFLLLVMKFINVISFLRSDGRDEPISLFAKVKKLTKANNKGVHASVIESSSKVANIYSSSRLTHPGNPYEGIAITASTRIPESYKEQPATPTKVKVEVSLKTKTQGSSSSSQSVDSVKQNVSTERAADEPESVRKNVKVSNRKRSDSEVQELVVKSKTFSNSSLQAAIQPSSSTKSIVQTSEPKKAVSSTPVEPIKVSSYSSPEAKIKCNCVKSRCLKLYCDCFAILKFCDATLCNCKDCYNCEDRAEIRNEAVKATKERNALAFQNKISDKAGHATGCRCKQSQCLKKYCECYNGGAYCGASCRCLSCQNFSGSNELERVKFETQYDSKPPIVDSRNSFYCKSSVMKNSLVGKKRKESPTSVSEAIKSPNPHLSSKGSSTIDHGKYKKVASSSEGQGGSNANHDTNMEISKVESDLEDKHKTKDSRIVITYPFFGPNLPEFTKLGMLRCFEYLEGKDIYSASIVNSLWCKAAMDEALWEPCE